MKEENINEILLLSNFKMGYDNIKKIIKKSGIEFRVSFIC